jgi:hypothetical protein
MEVCLRGRTASNAEQIREGSFIKSQVWKHNLSSSKNSQAERVLHYQQDQMNLILLRAFNPPQFVVSTHPSVVNTGNKTIPRWHPSRYSFRFPKNSKFQMQYSTNMIQEFRRCSRLMVVVVFGCGYKSWWWVAVSVPSTSPQLRVQSHGKARSGTVGIAKSSIANGWLVTETDLEAPSAIGPKLKAWNRVYPAERVTTIESQRRLGDPATVQQSSSLNQQEVIECVTSEVNEIKECKTSCQPVWMFYRNFLSNYTEQFKFLRVS